MYYCLLCIINIGVLQPYCNKQNVGSNQFNQYQIKITKYEFQKKLYVIKLYILSIISNNLHNLKLIENKFIG